MTGLGLTLHIFNKTFSPSWRYEMNVGMYKKVAVKGLMVVPPWVGRILKQLNLTF